MTNCTSGCDGCGKEPPKVLPDWKKVFVSRQEFLKLVGFAGGALIGLMLAIPGVAFVLNYLWVPLKKEWIVIGPVEDFKPDQTVDVHFEDPYSLPWDGVVGKRTAWLRRNSDDTFLAFALNCTHLGCPVRWEAKARLFLCPCHGGVYYANGDVAGGPPPYPLHQYKVRVREGQVEIHVGEVLNEA
ncbi:MAG TPA: Rieske (2Fe-2S) protein [Planktothrix sp.]|jgi:menaquinol-cytochrome c reductase iron-sulfur subunit